MPDITREMQIEELTKRVPPVLNANIVILKAGKYLIGKRNKEHLQTDSRTQDLYQHWLFPGSRMRYDETPEQATERILHDEVPGVRATLRKLITVLTDLNIDPRSRNVDLFYLYEYQSGSPKPNNQLEEFSWVKPDEIKEIPHILPGAVKIIQDIDQAVRTMHSNQDETLVEYDKNDQEIGTITKREAHNDPNRFHRAAHIAIFNSKGEVILQQRGFLKDNSPGQWDIHGGHQVAGHTIEQTALNELAEELGVDTKLTFHSKILLEQPGQSEFAYLFWGVDNGPYGFDRNEVEQIKTFKVEKLLNHEYDAEYTFLPHVYEYMEKLRSIWQDLRR